MKKWIPFLFVCLVAGTLSACSINNTIEKKESENTENVSDKETENIPSTDVSLPGSDDSEKETSGDETKDGLLQRFGENCITDQTFEVELSEYNGKVWFVPFAPSEEDPDFRIQIIRDSETLAELPACVPDSAAQEPFRSLDAVSFFDINFDGYTDIVLIETYGDTSFAAVYYGFDANAGEYERAFFPERELSEAISAQITPLTIPEIRNALFAGKKNGEFTDYKEAYRAVSRFYEMEETSERQYNLIYFDEDDTPELVCSVNGFRTSLYTYDNGRVYALMNRWPYGAMGNAGYEYSPRNNSLRNYNSDFAGAIMYTTYMAINEDHILDTVVQIETHQFDDVNENGIPDEGEEESIGLYGKNYIDGREASDEECASYNAGEYTYIEGILRFEELNAQLN